MEKPSLLRIDLPYSLITLATAAQWALMGGWLLYFYLPPDGAVLVPAALYGLAMAGMRAASALSAPLVGRLSDHLRGRWGRRAPLMAVSGLPLCVLFVLLWLPPVRSESAWNLAYLTAVLGAYSVVFSLNQVPYMALLPEIAEADTHRVRVSAWTSGMLLAGMVVGGLASPLIEHLGYAPTALAYAVFSLPLLYLPLLYLRERPERQIAAEARLSWRESFAFLAKNKPFVVMTLAGFCFWAIPTLILAILPFVVTEVCALDAGDAWMFYLGALLPAALCYPLVTRLAASWGKKPLFAASLALSAVVLPGLTMVDRPWQGLVWIALQAVAMSPVAMLPPVFGAEIVDQDEALTHQRREGAYYSAWAFLDQVVKGAVELLLPLLLLLGRSRADAHGPLGVRLAAVLGGVLLFVGFLAFRRYPETPEKRVV